MHTHSDIYIEVSHHVIKGMATSSVVKVAHPLRNYTQLRTSVSAILRYSHYVSLNADILIDASAQGFPHPF